MFAWAEKPSPTSVAGVGDAALARVDGGLARGVDDGDLAEPLAVVGGDLGVESGARLLPRLEPVEQPGSVGGLRHRLGRDDTDARAAPGDHGPDREPVRLDGDPQLAGRRVAGDHRVGHGPTGTLDLIESRRQVFPARTSEIWSFWALDGPPCGTATTSA